jgi:hypothetical protein
MIAKINKSGRRLWIIVGKNLVKDDRGLFYIELHLVSCVPKSVYLDFRFNKFFSVAFFVEAAFKAWKRD